MNISICEELQESIVDPVIASINCITPYEWPQFAFEIEKAGADALELNIFFMPSDPQRMSALSKKVTLRSCMKS